MFSVRLARLQARAVCFFRPHTTACACAAREPLQVSEPEPASVSEYHQHVLIKLTPPDGHQDSERANGSWWQKFVEKDPAVFEAFKALAKNQQAVSSTVKITAFDDVGSRQQPAPGTCEVMAFPEGVRYCNLPLASLGDVVLRTVADDPSELAPLEKDIQQLQEELHDVVVLLVCCHGARDARCGTIGPPLAAKLLALLREKGLQDRVKYAGNVLVYGAVHPCDGDWFGGISTKNAEKFLEGIANIEIGADGGTEDPVLRQWWRGRMGLSKEEQRELYEQGGAIETVADLEASAEEDGEGVLTEEDEELEGLEELRARWSAGGGGPSWPSR